MGERQRVVEEEERAKMAALAEQMSNESAQREGEVRRRHEAAMAKLALNREQQVTNSFAAPQTSHRPATVNCIPVNRRPIHSLGAEHIWSQT